MDENKNGPFSNKAWIVLIILSIIVSTLLYIKNDGNSNILKDVNIGSVLKKGDGEYSSSGLLGRLVFQIKDKINGFKGKNITVDKKMRENTSIINSNFFRDFEDAAYTMERNSKFTPNMIEENVIVDIPDDNNNAITNIISQSTELGMDNKSKDVLHIMMFLYKNNKIKQEATSNFFKEMLGDVFKNETLYETNSKPLYEAITKLINGKKYEYTNDSEKNRINIDVTSGVGQDLSYRYYQNNDKKDLKFDRYLYENITNKDWYISKDTLSYTVYSKNKDRNYVEYFSKYNLDTKVTENSFEIILYKKDFDETFADEVSKLISDVSKISNTTIKNDLMEMWNKKQNLDLSKYKIEIKTYGEYTYIKLIIK